MQARGPRSGRVPVGLCRMVWLAFTSVTCLLGLETSGREALWPISAMKAMGRNIHVVRHCQIDHVIDVSGKHDLQSINASLRVHPSHALSLKRAVCGSLSAGRVAIGRAAVADNLTLRPVDSRARGEGRVRHDLPNSPILLPKTPSRKVCRHSCPRHLIHQR